MELFAEGDARGIKKIAAVFTLMSLGLVGLCSYDVIHGPDTTVLEESPTHKLVLSDTLLQPDALIIYEKTIDGLVLMEEYAIGKSAEVTAARDNFKLQYR